MIIRKRNNLNLSVFKTFEYAIFFIFIFLVSCSSLKQVEKKDSQNQDKAIDIASLFKEDIFEQEINENEIKKAHVIIINFWATWCKPCKSEIPLLNSLYKANKNKGLLVYSINVNDSSELGSVRQWVKSNQIEFPVINEADGAIVSDLNPRLSLPFNVFVVNKKIKRVYKGFNLTDFEALKTEIHEILK